MPNTSCVWMLGLVMTLLDYGAGHNGPDYPVVGMDWDQTRQYTTWLANLSGMPFRLPTEAEWEYAARGPDDWSYPWGDGLDETRLNFCDINCSNGWYDETKNDG